MTVTYTRFNTIGYDTPIPALDNYLALVPEGKLIYRALGETVGSRQICFLHTDNKLYIQDVTVPAEAKALLLMALGGGAANDVAPAAIECYMKHDTVFPSTTEGVPYYCDKATPGGATVTFPPSSADNIRPCGFVLAIQTIYFKGDMPWLGVVP